MDENYNLEYTFFYSSIPFLFIALMGNVSIIRIVYELREMHKPTNYLLVSMAVSDVIAILLRPLQFYEFWEVVCKLAELIKVCILVSYFTMTVLAVERYHAILKPLREREREKGLEQRRQIHIKLNQAKRTCKNKELECIMSKFSHTFFVNVLSAFESLHIFYTL